MALGLGGRAADRVSRCTLLACQRPDHGGIGHSWRTDRWHRTRHFDGTSWLSFGLPDRARHYCLGLGRRANQPDQQPCRHHCCGPVGWHWHKACKWLHLWPRRLRHLTSVPADPFLDRGLIAGSILFGAGWALAGLCPGPAIASLSFGGWGGAVFLLAMLAGMLAASAFRRPLKKPPLQER